MSSVGSASKRRRADPPKKTRGPAAVAVKKSSGGRARSGSNASGDEATVQVVLCRWTDLSVHQAEVIHRRPAKKNPIVSSSLSSRSSGTSSKVSSKKLYEYYVHYINFDRRLDEWISADRIVVEDEDAGQVSESEAVSRARKVAKDSKVKQMQKLEAHHEDTTKIKNIRAIRIGQYDIDTWYFSPYPLGNKSESEQEKLYICECCLKPTRTESLYTEHKAHCTRRQPPGKIIYDEDDLTVFEVDASTNRLYCQCLCLLGKLFLDHKTLYFDLRNFLFYVLCRHNQQNGTFQIMGYFSKEIQSLEDYNLATVVVLPPYQRQGLGNFLISLSYELTKKEGKVGSPEKPLSDLGKLSYHKYWSAVVVKYLDNTKLPQLSIQDISKLTGITPDDVALTLQCLQAVKYWKGRYVIFLSKEVLEAQKKQSKAKPLKFAHPNCLCV